MALSLLPRSLSTSPPARLHYLAQEAIQDTAPSGQRGSLRLLCLDSAAHWARIAILLVSS